MQNKTKFPFPWFPGLVPGWGRRPGGAHLPPLPLDWAFLPPKSRLSLGAYVPFLSWRLHSGTSPAFFYRPRGLLGNTRVQKDWSPSKKGLPIKAEHMSEAGEVDRERLRAGCLSQSSRGSFTEQEGGGIGHRMEFWNTRIEVASGLRWLAA